MAQPPARTKPARRPAPTIAGRQARRPATPAPLPRGAAHLAAAAAPRIDALADLFKVLADPTRLRLLTALLTAPRSGAAPGALCVHELCDRVAMSQPAVSHQLRVLRQARLVRGRRDGREIFYALDDAHVLAILAEALRHAEHDEPAGSRDR